MCVCNVMNKTFVRLSCRFLFPHLRGRYMLFSFFPQIALRLQGKWSIFLRIIYHYAIRKVSLFRQSFWLTLKLSDKITWQNVSLGLEFLQQAVSEEGQIDPLIPGRLEYTQYLNWLSHLILSWGRKGQNHSLDDSLWMR